MPGGIDQPWDSEQNLKLLEKMPAVYRSAHAPDGKPGHTHYQGFASKKGALEGAGQRIRDFTDGTSNTLLLVESAESVPWTKPQDLTEIPAFLEGPEIHVLMTDGSVRVEKELDSLTLQKMITRNGGEHLTR